MDIWIHKAQHPSASRHMHASPIAIGPCYRVLLSSLRYPSNAVLKPNRSRCKYIVHRRQTKVRDVASPLPRRATDGRRGALRRPKLAAPRGERSRYRGRGAPLRGAPRRAGSVAFPPRPLDPRRGEGDASANPNESVARIPADQPPRMRQEAADSGDESAMSEMGRPSVVVAVGGRRRAVSKEGGPRPAPAEAAPREVFDRRRPMFRDGNAAARGKPSTTVGVPMRGGRPNADPSRPGGARAFSPPAPEESEAGRSRRRGRAKSPPRDSSTKRRIDCRRNACGDPSRARPRSTSKLCLESQNDKCEEYSYAFCSSLHQLLTQHRGFFSGLPRHRQITKITNATTASGHDLIFIASPSSICWKKRCAFSQPDMQMKRRTRTHASYLLYSWYIT